MMVYLLLYGFIFFISVISIIKKKENVGYIILTIVITLLVVMRFDTGWDYYWYWYVGDKKFEETFYYSHAYNSLEYFYRKLYDVVRILEFPPLFFQITGLVSSFFIYKGIYKNSKFPLVSLSVYISGTYFFIFSLGFIRQHIAINALLYVYIYLKEDKLWKYIIFVILISLVFHYSALVGILFIFIKKVKLRYSIIGILLIPFFTKVLYLITQILMPKYLNYFIKAEAMKIPIQIKVYIIIGIIIEIIRKNKRIKIDENIESKKIFWCGILIYILLNNLFGGHTGIRIANYMIIFIIFYILDFIIFFKNKKIIELLLVMFFLLMGSVSIIKGTREENKFPISSRKNLRFEFIFNKTEDNFQGKALP